MVQENGSLLEAIEEDGSANNADDAKMIEELFQKKLNSSSFYLKIVTRAIDVEVDINAKKSWATALEDMEDKVSPRHR